MEQIAEKDGKMTSSLLLIPLEGGTVLEEIRRDFESTCRKLYKRRNNARHSKVLTKVNCRKKGEDSLPDRKRALESAGTAEILMLE